MSLGPPIRPTPPSTDPKETWVPVPGKPQLEQNLERPPKFRTKNHEVPGANPWPFRSLTQPAAPTTPPVAEDNPGWGIFEDAE